MNFLILFFYLHSFAQAFDQVVVTASKEDLQNMDNPYFTHVLDEESIEKFGIQNALSQTSGLYLSTSNSAAQTQSIFLRGANANDTLVIYDGIVLNDPLSPGRGFDFSELPFSIEKVEVFKGLQSVVYGSNAMGGVIQLTSPKNSNNRKWRIYGGSYQTLGSSLYFHGFFGNYEESKGFSSADEREGNREKDGTRNYSLGGTKYFEINPSTVLLTSALFSDRKIDTDRNGGPMGDSQTFARTNSLLMHAQIEHSRNSRQSFSLSGSAQIRNKDDNTVTPTNYKSHLWKLNSQWNQSLSSHKIILGLEHAQEKGQSTDLSSPEKISSSAAFAQDHFVFGRFHSILGIRKDFYSNFNAPESMRTAIGYWIKPQSLQIKTSIGTAHKIPSLYQLYSSYGNQRLTTEKNLATDIGLHFQIPSTLNLDLIFFQNTFKNLIDYDFITSKYLNLGKAKSYGVEQSAQLDLQKWKIEHAFTFTRAIDENTHLPLLRRPKYQEVISVTHEFLSGNVGAHFRYVGKREDIHPTLYTRQTMPAYFITSLFTGWKYNQTTQIKGKIDNLFQRRYQEISGYGTAGLSATISLECDI